MPITLKAQPLAEAVARLDARTPVGSVLRSAEWAELPRQLQQSAHLSAGVEWARFLSESKGLLSKSISLTREQLGNGKTALIDRSSFIGDMRRVVAGGRASGAIAAPDAPGTLTDIGSRVRLGLIFDMQTRSAHGYTEWKSGQDSDLLNLWPAQELLPSTARQPRGDWDARWQAAGDSVNWEGALRDRMVALKTSPIWAALSRFGVPWTPFDFGSTRQLRDVARAQAIEWGLIAETTQLQPQDQAFDAELQAEVTNIDPDLLNDLLKVFGNQVQLVGNVVKWVGVAA